MQINPYLTFAGQCEEAFTFYADVLGGRIELMERYRGSPVEEYAPGGDLDKIMHTRLVIGDQMLMASDGPSGSQEEVRGISVSIGVDDPAEADRIFEALSQGGSVSMPIDETFWALRFGGLVDRFGIPWLVNCDRPEEG